MIVERVSEERATGTARAARDPTNQKCWVTASPNPTYETAKNNRRMIKLKPIQAPIRSLPRRTRQRPQRDWNSSRVVRERAGVGVKQFDAKPCVFIVLVYGFKPIFRNKNGIPYLSKNSE